MAKFTRESIDRFFDYDIHVETRTIYMGSAEYVEGGESGTDFLMAEKIIKALHLLDNQAPEGDKPITILMSNFGGDVTHGLAIYDAIQACVNHITIKVFGSAQSMGSVILQAADERIMSPNSVQMIHYGSISVAADSKIAQKQIEENKRIDDWMEQVYLVKIKEKLPDFKLSKLKNLLTHDTFLTAEESVKLGLADKVLE